MALPLRSVALASLAASAAALAIAGPAGAAVTRTTLSGPSADTAVTGFQQVSLDAAPDGTVAAAFLKTVGAQTHVYVARGSNGTLDAPVRVDTTLSDPSGAPVVGVGNGGRVFVAFANGPAAAEKLYKVTADGTAGALSAPVAIDPTNTGYKGAVIDLAPNGSGYLAAHEGFHLRAFAIAGATATPVGTGASAILNETPTDQLEAGDQRGVHLAVDLAGATGVLAWCEPTATPGTYKTEARRLTGTSPAQIGAAVSPDLTTLDGNAAADGANDMTWVATGGGQTYVSFRQFFTYPKPGGGTTNIPRLIARSFDGSTFGPARVLDSLGATPPATPADPTQLEGSEFARVSLNASNQGLSGSYRQLTFSTESATKPAGGEWTTGSLVAGLGTTKAAGRATTALTDAGVGLLAAYNEPTPGNGQILGRISGGTQDGAVLTLSDPAAGPATTISEAATSTDFALVAFRQGAAATSRVTVAKVDLPVPPTPTPTPELQHVPPEGDATIVPKFAFLRLSKLRITRADLKPIVISATGKSKSPYLEFNIDRPSRIALWAERVTIGRRGSGGKCEKPTKSNRKGKACTKYALIKGQTVVLDRPAGTTRVRFTGRLTGKHALPAGKYRLGLTAADQATGGLTPIQHLTFTLR